jgi:hypothetical protein
MQMSSLPPVYRPRPPLTHRRLKIFATRFVNDPLGFDEAYKRVHDACFPDGLTPPFCAYQDLVTLKTVAGRPQDLADLQELRTARGET